MGAWEYRSIGVLECWSADYRWEGWEEWDGFAAFLLVGFVFEGLAFAVFFAALASAISANTFSIRRI